MRKLGMWALLALLGTSMYAWGETGHLPANTDIYVAADNGACIPTYSDRAWNICGIVIPAPTEDYYTLTYVDPRGWVLSLNED